MWLQNVVYVQVCAQLLSRGRKESKEEREVRSVEVERCK